MSPYPKIRVIPPLLFLLLFILAACAPPQTSVATNVLPTIFSVRTEGNGILIQGRYLGTGAGGAAAGNYVEVGADLDGRNGTAYEAAEWSDKRVRLTLPASLPSGSVRVFAGGRPSNILPLSRD